MKHKTSSLIAALLCTTGATAQVVPCGAELLQEADRTTSEPGVSPVRRIQRGPALPLGEDLPWPGVRSIDGTVNNPNDAELNAAETRLARYMEADYADGIWTMAGQNRPGPREVSNAANAEASSIPNSRGANDFFWQWGQFLDRDIDLTDGIDPPESEPIAIDPFRRSLVRSFR